MLRIPAAPPSVSTPEVPDLLAMLHATSPYDGFDATRYPLDLQGWNGESALFGQLIEECQPSLVIEVGSWQGQSAINMARHLARLPHPTQLLCVDTWLGSADFWLMHDDMTYRGLRHCHGYPTVYYQFLANVVHCGLQDIIVPFPAVSTVAAGLLFLRQVRAELIYIDGSHEEYHAIGDMIHYWNLLKPGGVMFGDDYRTEYFPGVVRAVERFCAELGITHEVIDGQYWLLRKPA